MGWLAGTLLGAACLLFAIAWRVGIGSSKVKGFVRQPTLPRIVRNFYIALLPFSVAWFAASLAGVAPGAFVVLPVALLVGAWFLIAPPDIAKPPWQREDERDGPPPIQRVDIAVVGLVVLFSVPTLIGGISVMLGRL